MIEKIKSERDKASEQLKAAEQRMAQLQEATSNLSAQILMQKACVATYDRVLIVLSETEKPAATEPEQ